MSLFFFIGRFLKMFLGPISVRATRKDVQLKVKEEYNSLKVSSSFWLIDCLLYFTKN